MPGAGIRDVRPNQQQQKTTSGNQSATRS